MLVGGQFLVLIDYNDYMGLLIGMYVVVLLMECMGIYYVVLELVIICGDGLCVLLNGVWMCWMQINVNVVGGEGGGLFIVDLCVC